MYSPSRHTSVNRARKALTPLLLLSTLAASSLALAIGGPSGLLTGGAEELPNLTLSSVEPLAAGPYELESGKYYEIEIVCDGSAELALAGAEFFRNIWIDEVVINDIEVRPLGLDSLEFDDEGTVEISFIAIRPGTYTVKVPNSRGDFHSATFVIKG